MASRELICRVGARREGVGDEHRFLSRVWVSSRVLVEREGRGGCCRCISYHGREGVYISTAPHVRRSYLEGAARAKASSLTATDPIKHKKTKKKYKEEKKEGIEEKIEEKKEEKKRRRRRNRGEEEKI